MNRKILAAFAVLLFGAGVIVACGGKEITVGTDAARQKEVDPKVVTTAVITPGGVPRCSQGRAHPSICCPATKDQSGACTTYINEPFHACDRGWNSFPDATQCCDLATSVCGGAAAVDTVGGPSATPGYNPGAPSNGTANAPPVEICGYPCKPGWYQTPGACCLHDPTQGNADLCENSAAIGKSAPPQAPACGPKSWLDPKGECCTGSRGPDGKLVIACGGGTPAQTTPIIDPAFCPTCPDGWAAAGGFGADNNTNFSDNRGVVCCRNDAQGQLCFSQAGATYDGPIPSADTLEAPRACGGTSGGKPGGPGCSCTSSHNGHSFALDCVGTSCTCSVDGHQVDTIASPSPLCPTSGTADKLWSSPAGCGFP